MTVYKPRMVYPIVIDATNNKIYYNYTAGSNGVGTVANGTYVTPESLATAVQAAIVAGTNPLTTVVVTVSVTGHFVFTDSAEFTMRWATTTNSIYAMLGATASNQLSGAVAGVGYVATTVNQHRNAWYAPGAVRFDSAAIRDRGMDVVTRAVSGQTKYISETELGERIIKFSYLPPQKVYAAHAVSGYANEDLETFWANCRARFRWWDDVATLLGPVDYVLSTKDITQFAPTRQFTRKALYEYEFKFWNYVA